jgi:hypothetical protein
VLKLCCLQLKGLHGRTLRSDEEFSGEGAFGGAAAQGFFGGDARDVGIVVLQREVRKN